MNFKEVKIEDAKSLAPDWEFIGRYTNRNGIKFYLEKKKQLGKKPGYNHQIKMQFGALPKYYDSRDFEPPNFIFEFGIAEMYMRKWIRESYLIEFLEMYGVAEFTNWLNEINESKSQSKETILGIGDEKIKPELIDGKLIAPTNTEDDNRLQKIAEETILTEFFNNRGRGPLNEESLIEKAFVPQYIFNHTYKILKDASYLDLQDGSLTLDGIDYYKNQSNYQLKQNKYSKTVFVGQAFNFEMQTIYKEVFEKAIKDVHLNPIIISEEEPDEPVDVEALNQIRQCRFMICDLTHARPSVYFEAGYAIAIGIKVLFTAREDHNSDHPKFDAQNNKIHFDLRNRQITWWKPDNLSEFKGELNDRIKRFLEYQKKQ